MNSRSTATAFLVLFTACRFALAADPGGASASGCGVPDAVDRGMMADGFKMEGRYYLHPLLESGGTVLLWPVAQPADAQVGKEAIRYWLRRMEDHVAKLTEQDRAELAPVFCDVYLHVNDISSAKRLAASIRAPEGRARASIMLAIFLAQSGRVKAATDVAESLPADSAVDPEQGKVAQPAGQGADDDRPRAMLQARLCRGRADDSAD